MNNIRELIIQRVFLNPLDLLRGLCCMSHRLCLFFFRVFLTLLHEETFSLAVVCGRNISKPSCTPGSQSGRCLYTYNASEIYPRGCSELKKIGAKLCEFLHEFTANISRKTLEDVHILLWDTSIKEITSTYLMKNNFPQILTQLKNHLCHSRMVATGFFQPDFLFFSLNFQPP